MSRELARKVADAVLYEGYSLYPYRPSALKNRQRWSFGILYPPAYAEVPAGTERCKMHTECLVECGEGAEIEVQLRFLQLAERQALSSNAECGEEGIERSVELRLALSDGELAPLHFSFGEGRDESLGIRRTWQQVSGVITARSERISDGVRKLIIEVENTTALAGDAANRQAALFRALLSAHTILSTRGGQFVSLLDPPAEIRDATHGCRNEGNFPVLVGTAPEREMMLCSPIILYDYPQIAPESDADFYDATEMDEMLTLRVMTLTPEEKNEVRAADEHVRALLERTEQNAREQLSRTHGTIRSLRLAE